MKSLKEQIRVSDTWTNNTELGDGTKYVLEKDLNDALIGFENDLQKLSQKYPEGLPVLTLLNIFRKRFG